MNELIKLSKKLKNGCCNIIDVTVTDKDFTAFYYTVYEDLTDTRDSISEKEVYNLGQLNAFLDRKLKEKYVKSS